MLRKHQEEVVCINSQVFKASNVSEKTLHQFMGWVICMCVLVQMSFAVSQRRKHWISTADADMRENSQTFPDLTHSLTIPGWQTPCVVHGHPQEFRGWKYIFERCCHGKVAYHAPLSCFTKLIVQLSGMLYLLYFKCFIETVQSLLLKLKPNYTEFTEVQFHCKESILTWFLIYISKMCMPLELNLIYFIVP